MPSTSFAWTTSLCNRLDLSFSLIHQSLDYLCSNVPSKQSSSSRVPLHYMGIICRFYQHDVEHLYLQSWFLYFLCFHQLFQHLHVFLSHLQQSGLPLSTRRPKHLQKPRGTGAALTAFELRVLIVFRVLIGFAWDSAQSKPIARTSTRHKSAFGADDKLWLVPAIVFCLSSQSRVVVVNDFVHFGTCIVLMRKFQTSELLLYRTAQESARYKFLIDELYTRFYDQAYEEPGLVVNTCIRWVHEQQYRWEDRSRSSWWARKPRNLHVVFYVASISFVVTNKAGISGWPSSTFALPTRKCLSNRYWVQHPKKVLCY